MAPEKAGDRQRAGFLPALADLVPVHITSLPTKIQVLRTVLFRLRNSCQFGPGHAVAIAGRAAGKIAPAEKH